MRAIVSGAGPLLRRLFGGAGAVRAEPPRLAPARRIYAIGDIHGRDDLLEALLDRIDGDGRARPEVATTLVFLGDYIDRGPGSAAVVERLMTLEKHAIFLMGNHEELLLRSMAGDQRAAAIFACVGGVETMASYGVDPASFAAAEAEEQIALMKAAISPRHLDWMESLPSSYVEGDYMFVHAGILPGLPIEDQPPEILRWIRGDFLASRKDHGKMIVHGHSVLSGIDERSNRIGIDTGAYFSGILTAVGLEEDRRWYVQTGDAIGPSE